MAILVATLIATLVTVSAKEAQGAAFSKTTWGEMRPLPAGEIDRLLASLDAPGMEGMPG